MGNRKIILVLSGEICTGKSTLTSHLENEFGFKICKTKDKLLSFATENHERGIHQQSGRSLDETTDGKWVLDYFVELFGDTFTEHQLYIIDSARIIQQIKHLRDSFTYSVFHIHLTASVNSLEERFYERGDIKDLSKEVQQKKYREYKTDPTEQQVPNLAADADLVIDTDRCNEEDVFIKVASYFKLLPLTHNRLVDIIIGGQFGSEGKGQIAAHISPEYDCLVRIGGPNAGHTVYEEPTKHVFHLLPSGSHRSSGAKLLLGAGTVINLKKILDEIREFNIEVGRLVIDENAIMISQEDIDGEDALKEKISSTAQGVGFATAKNLIERLKNEDKHKAKHVKELRPYIGSITNELELLYRDGRKILLEGTQGTGLSLHHGLYPHVTSRDTSASGCLSEAGISPKRVRKIIMVTRTYPIRVGGASGDFRSKEIDFRTIAERSGLDEAELIKKEITTTTKKSRRIAEFSWHLFRKACELNSPTDIALTFTDYISADNIKARRYDQLTTATREMIEEIERCSGVKVSLIGTTFDYRAVIDRRNWK